MKQKVTIVGGGIAGLTAAMELNERGYEVTVLESQKQLGGKAYSFINADGMPGEHGFRFYLSWYAHLFEIFERIAVTKDGVKQSLFDHLVKVRQMQYGSQLYGSGMGVFKDLKITLSLSQILLSSDERIEKEFENKTWKSLIEETMQGDYDQEEIDLLAKAPKVLVATKTEDASAVTVLKVMSRFFCNPSAYILDGPTNDVFIDPWQHYLEKKGVTFFLEHEVKQLHTYEDSIHAITVQTPLGVSKQKIENIILAVPINVLSYLVTQEISQRDPQLARVKKLKTQWMCGLQLYTKQRLELPDGHIGYPSSPWALSSIQQTDYWSKAFQLKDGHAHAVQSIIISDFDKPGMLYGKSAKACSPHEIKDEVVAQLIAHSGTKTMQQAYMDCEILSWQLDPSLSYDGLQMHNSRPLFVNTVHSWENRPTCHTQWGNLFIASDYVQNHTDVATMESACEGGKLAAQAFLDKESSNAFPVKLFNRNGTDIPKSFRMWKLIDRYFFSKGKTHPFTYVEDETRQSFEALLQKTFQEGLDQLGTMQESSDELVLIDVFESLIKNMGYEHFLDQEADDKNTEGLVKRIQAWSGLHMKQVTKNPIEPPSYMDHYINISHPMYEPMTYISKSKGSGHRIHFGLGLNHWLNAPASKVNHLFELGQALHNSSLLIDDIMDNEAYRRNQQSAHHIYGIGQTMGVAYSAVFQMLLSSSIYLGKEITTDLIEEIARAHHGQLKEMFYRDQLICPDIEEYYMMIDDKTGSLFRIMSKAIIKLSSKKITPEIENAFDDFARKIGYFFQIRDDYLDLTSDEYAQKKGRIASDLDEGKYSLPIIYLLRNKPQYRQKVMKYFSKYQGGMMPANIKKEILALMQESHALEDTLHELQTLFDDLQTLYRKLSNYFQTLSPQLKSWMDKLGAIEGIVRTRDQETKRVEKQRLELTEVSTFTIKRAIRNIVASYHPFFVYQGVHDDDFWYCFPLLVTVETYILILDDFNEDTKNKKITEEALYNSKLFTLLETLGWKDDFITALIPKVISFYDRERAWLSKELTILDQDEVFEHHKGKALGLHIQFWLIQKVLQSRGVTPPRPLSKSVLDDLALYMQLQVERFEAAEDEKVGVYNITSHLYEILHDHTEVQKVLEMYEQKIYDRLCLEDSRLIESAGQWFEVMKLSKKGEVVSMSFSIRQFLSIADKISTTIKAQPTLSKEILGSSKNYMWIYAMFITELEPQLTVMQDLSKDIMVSLHRV